MKTLLFTLEYPPFHGGVANYYGNLAKYWPIEEKLAVLDNNRQELTSHKGFLGWLPSLFALGRKLRDKFDYVLVGQILPLGTAAYLISLFQPIKYAVFLHGMDLALALRSPRKKLLSKLILKRADKIICANTYVEKKLYESFPELETSSSVINPGIEGGAPDVNPAELAEFKKLYNLEDKTVLFSLGRLVRRKGFDRTIAALAQMPDAASKNLVYFIAGVGPQEEYLKKSVPKHIFNKITFLGSLTEREKWLWLRACDIFIMPSRDIAGDFEGFGIVYLEANLCGKPVIAGDSGGVRDAVVDGKTGLLADPEDIYSISQAITCLAGDKDLCAELGRQGCARALKEFNWEKQAAAICQFIKR